MNSQPPIPPLPGVSAPPIEPLDTTVSLLLYPLATRGHPPHCGEIQPAYAKHGGPYSHPSSPPNLCHAPPPLSLGGRVLVLTTSILVEPNHPSTPTPATLTPLSHFSKLPCPPLTHPKLGSLVNYKIFPSDLLYTPLYPPTPLLYFFYSVRSPHGVWQEVNFSPPPNHLPPLPNRY